MQYLPHHQSSILYAQDISTRHMFQEKFGGISPLLLFVMVRSYLLHLHKNGPSQDIFSQEYQLFFTSYLQGSFLHNTYLHIFCISLIESPIVYKTSFKTYSYVVKGFSDIPPASTLGKVYPHYNLTNDLTSRSNILASIGNTSFS